MNAQYFLAGCIGGIAPEIVRLYQIRLRRRRLRFSSFYYCVSVLYVVLAGCIAGIFPGLPGPFWAMCIGVGTVPTVNAMMKVAELMTLRVRANLEKELKDVYKSGGTPDFTGMFPGDFPAASKPAQGDLWDYVKCL